MIAYAAHSIEAPDVHDGICSTLMIWTKTYEVIALSASVVAMLVKYINEQ